MAAEVSKESFFTRDKVFYKTLFGMMCAVSLQNLVAYSINMTDNIMLGSYSQEALSGAAIVNQIFFVVQYMTFSLGSALVVLTSQYWGRQKIGPIRELTGIALKAGLVFGACVVLVCFFFPDELLHLFTRSDAIVAEGKDYLQLIQWTFILFIISNTLLASLRSVGTVKIAFYISVVSLIVNAGINYVLIFGHFGFPEMGIRGAAVGTFIARIVELAIVVVYAMKVDKKIFLFSGTGLLKQTGGLSKDFSKVAWPILIAQIFWCVSVPIQTAILGHLSDDAIAANSVATTFFQYLKVIVFAISSTSGVLIGNAIGRGDLARIRSDARTLSVIDITLGIILAVILFSLRYPLMSLYQLSDSATELSINLIAVMSIVMVGMSYQMPVLNGIIQGSGDTRFVMILTIVSIWAIVMPLSFLSAFVWHWPVELVVLVIQSDQIFKCVPAFWRFRSYKWIRQLAR